MSAWLAPHAHPAGVEGFFAVSLMWLVMMTVMMLPAVGPWLRTFAAVAGDAYPGRSRGRLVGQFAGGYLVIWGAYSVVAAGLQGGLQSASLLRLDASLMAPAGGVLLIVAGLFQLTPLKEACLAHCRSPLSYFLQRWDGGPSGPFRMGLRHGAWCVGCCWALMGLTFVLGVMNALWMAALTGFVAAEQRAPKRWRLAPASGAVLCVWGIWLLTT